MAHGIFVCLEHKRLMHSSRNIGIHSRRQHDVECSELMERGVIVEIGQCANTLWQRCKDPHDRAATEQEIKQALSLKDEQIKRIKQEREEMLKQIEALQKRG